MGQKDRQRSAQFVGRIDFCRGTDGIQGFAKEKICTKK